MCLTCRPVEPGRVRSRPGSRGPQALTQLGLAVGHLLLPTRLPRDHLPPWLLPPMVLHTWGFSIGKAITMH